MIRIDWFFWFIITSIVISILKVSARSSVATWRTSATSETTTETATTTVTATETTTETATGITTATGATSGETTATATTFSEFTVTSFSYTKFVFVSVSSFASGLETVNLLIDTLVSSSLWSISNSIVMNDGTMSFLIISNSFLTLRYGWFSYESVFAKLIFENSLIRI